MLDLARGRAKGHAAGDRLSFHEAESMDYLAGAQPCDLLVAVGAGSA